MQPHSEHSEVGSGFLITCDKNKEKQAIKDAFNFLTEYIEDIYGDIETQIIHRELDKLGKEHSLENQMQIRSTMKNKLKLLTSPDTSVNCLIFIKINESITKINPYEVVSAIMKDVHENQRELTRYCHKILPVQKSFKAEHFKMLDQIDNMFQARDNSQIKSWALNFKCRNNSKFQYKEVLAKTEQIVKKYGHFVDIYYPQLTICVQIVHHLMCLAVVEGYKQYDQFRLHKKGNPTHSNPSEKSDKTQKIRQKIQIKQLQRQQQKEKNIKKGNKQQQKHQQQGQHKQKQKLQQRHKIAISIPAHETQQKQKRGPPKQDQRENGHQQQEKKNSLLHEQIVAKNDDDDDNII